MDWVSGPGGPPLSLQALISFSDNTIGISLVVAARKHSCALRCDGAVICFGWNFMGQVGLSSHLREVGSNPLDMTAVAGPVPLDPTRVPLATPGCPARLVNVVLNPAVAVPNFAPWVTTYLFPVAPATALLSVTTATTVPPLAEVTVNGVPRRGAKSWGTALTSSRINLITVRVAWTGYEDSVYSIYVRRFPAPTVHSGHSFACILTTKLACWGSNILGELGRDNVVDVGKLPTDMTMLTFISFSASLNGYDVYDVEAGFYNACALLSNGAMLCWGENLYAATGAKISSGGNVGDGLGMPMNQVDGIEFKYTHAVVQIATGHHVTCGKDHDSSHIGSSSRLKR